MLLLYYPNTWFDYQFGKKSSRKLKFNTKKVV